VTTSPKPRVVSMVLAALTRARSALDRGGIRLPRTIPHVAAVLFACAFLQLAPTRMQFARDVGGSPGMLQEWGGIPGSPWMTRYCVEFSTPDPLGCTAWYAEISPLSWSAAVGFAGMLIGLLGLMIWLRSLPTRPSLHR
jgi:hypothetical protein